MLLESLKIQPVEHCGSNCASKIFRISSVHADENVHLVMKTSQHTQNTLSSSSSISSESDEVINPQNIQFSKSTLSENQQGKKNITTKGSKKDHGQERSKRNQIQSHCNNHCQMIHNEWQLLQSMLPHPNIVKVYKVFQNIDNFCQSRSQNLQQNTTDIPSANINQQSKQMHQQQLLNIHEQTHADSCCALLMEEAQMDLFDLVENFYNNDKRKMITILINMFSQIAYGLEHIHSSNHSHNDIKCENILIFNQYNDVKITDFGLSNNLSQYKNLTKSQICKQQIQQWEYRNLEHAAPEIIEMLKNQSSCFDEQKADVFAFGVSLFESIFGFRPFQLYAQSTDQIYKHFKNKQTFSRFWKTNPQIQQVLKEINTGDIDINILFDLLFKTLRQNPSKRISSAELIVHPLFD